MRPWTWCALVAFAGACGGTAAPPPPVRGVGTAIFDWTVDGTKDPAACTATGAATFQVSLFDSAGGFVGAWAQDCAAFAVQLDGLLEGTYGGQAVLLDRAGHPRTTTIDLAPFLVVGGASVVVALDFPTTSFF